MEPLEIHEQHEGRLHKRVDFNQYVRVSDFDGQTICFGKTLNLSEGGICILCDSELQTGQMYKITFNLEYGRTRALIAASTLVVYQYTDDIFLRTGCKFVDEQDLQNIKDFLNGA